MPTQRRMSLRRVRERTLRAAHLRSTGQLSARRGLFVGALSLAVVLAACGSKKPKNIPDVDDPNDVVCTLDPSKSVETAYDAVLGEAVHESFCPRSDVDYWRYDVTTPSLLLVDLG